MSQIALVSWKPLMLAIVLAVCPLVAIQATAQEEDAGEVEVDRPDASPASATTKEKPPQTLSLADGVLKLELAARWEKTPPRSRIVEHEFAIPAPPSQGQNDAEADAEAGAGRLTVMAAGGGVEANVARWVGQFKNPAGGPLPKIPEPQQPAADAQAQLRAAKDVAVGQRVWKRASGDQTLWLVDLRGTFVDRPRGPFGPAVEREDYRMLGLIVPTAEHGTWFFKLYGPRKTIDASASEFARTVESVQYRP